jgi:hypothetical protein
VGQNGRREEAGKEATDDHKQIMNKSEEWQVLQLVASGRLFEEVVDWKCSK